MKVLIPRNCPIYGFPTTGKSTFGSEAKKVGVGVSDFDDGVRFQYPRLWASKPWRYERDSEIIRDVWLQAKRDVIQQAVDALNSGRADYFTCSVWGNDISNIIVKYPIGFVRTPEAAYKLDQQRGGSVPRKLFIKWYEDLMNEEWGIRKHVDLLIVLEENEGIASRIVEITPRGIEVEV